MYQVAQLPGRFVDSVRMPQVRFDK